MFPNTSIHQIYLSIIILYSSIHDLFIFHPSLNHHPFISLHYSTIPYSDHNPSITIIIHYDYHLITTIPSLHYLLFHSSSIPIPSIYYIIKSIPLFSQPILHNFHESILYLSIHSISIIISFYLNHVSSTISSYLYLSISIHYSTSTSTNYPYSYHYMSIYQSISIHSIISLSHSIL